MHEAGTLYFRTSIDFLILNCVNITVLLFYYFWITYFRFSFFFFRNGEFRWLKLQAYWNIGLFESRRIWWHLYCRMTIRINVAFIRSYDILVIGICVRNMFRYFGFLTESVKFTSVLFIHYLKQTFHLY